MRQEAADPDQAIAAVLQRLRDSVPFTTERERAVALHDYVREEIAFGFTTGFEAVTPLQTLARRRGHCNAQADLMCALLRAAGLTAGLRFVRLDKRILRAAVPRLVYLCLPAHLFHAVTRVAIDGAWRHCDSYLFRQQTFARLRHQRHAAGHITGFGLSSQAVCVWDGRHDAFSQALPTDLRHADPLYDTLAQAMAARAGNNRLLGVHFNRWLACVPAGWRQGVEAYLNGQLPAAP